MLSSFVALALLAAAPPPASAQAPAPTRVYAGVFLTDLSSFDLKEGRFQADLQVWCKWAGDAEPPRLSFENGEISSQEEVARESEGSWHSVRWRVQGTFRGRFPLRNFPFDSQVLRIELAMPEARGELLPDLASSGTSPQFSVTGWIHEPYFQAGKSRRTLPSDLGSIATEGGPAKLESLAFSVEMTRPFAAYLVKFLLPLGIILVMSVLATFVPAEQLETRVSIGVTALLACVAVHFTQADSLPEVPYLVIADKLFLGSYVLVLAVLIGSVAGAKMLDAHPARVRRMDRAIQIGIPGIAIIGVLVMVPRGDRSARETVSPRPPPVVAVESPRKALIAGVPSLPTVTGNGLLALTRRGLSYADSAGVRHAHLVETLPEMTNEYVRFLPDGGMRIRWRLRPGLRWSDGTPITARDLEFSASVDVEPQRVSVTRVDERTVDVVWADRLPARLEGFVVHCRAAIAPVIAKDGADAITKAYAAQALPGDGPFVLAAFEKDRTATFRRNPHFAGPKPALEEIRVVAFPSTKEAVEALSRGELDVVPNASAQALEAIASADVAIDARSADTLTFLQPDLSVKGLDRIEVRRALLEALDREKIASLLYGTSGRIAVTYRDPASADADPSLAPVPRAPMRAAAVLRGAFAKPLAFTYVDGGAGTPHMRTVESIQADLSTAGVPLSPNPVTTSLELFEGTHHGGLLLYNRKDTGALAPWWNVPASEGGGGWDLSRGLALDDATRELLRLHDGSPFEERRLLLSRRLQRAWAERLPLIPLVVGGQSSVRTRRLSGVDPGRANPFWNVEVWTLAER